MTRLLVLLAVLASLASATSAPTFCKCTCFKNSTIIALGPQPPSHPDSLTRRSASASCAQCTKSFCLDNRIPFCADATEADVTTLCFQRDSLKDRFIVWGFMVVVVGLLGTAAFRRGLEWRRQRSANGREDAGRGHYTVLRDANSPAIN